MPANRLATKKPPLKAKTVFWSASPHSTAVPTRPTTLRTTAKRRNAGRAAPSFQTANPEAIAAPTNSACARVSVP